MRAIKDLKYIDQAISFPRDRTDEWLQLIELEEAIFEHVGERSTIQWLMEMSVHQRHKFYILTVLRYFDSIGLSYKWEDIE